MPSDPVEPFKMASEGCLVDLTLSDSDESQITYTPSSVSSSPGVFPGRSVGPYHFEDEIDRASPSSKRCPGADKDLVDLIDDDTDEETDITASLEVLEVVEDEDELIEEAAINDEHRYDNLTARRVVIDLLDDEEPIPTQEETLVLEPIKVGNVTYSPGKTVEFTDGSFMRVKNLVKDVEGEVFVNGQIFVRQESFWPRLPYKRNELIWIQNASKSRQNLAFCKAISNRHLIVTNRGYSDFSLKDHPDRWYHKQKDMKHGPLFCRYKRTEIVSNKKLAEESWESITAEEADGEYRVTTAVNRLRYRGRPTQLGGSSRGERITIDENGNLTQEEVSQYTFGDAFCGAGGTSCGAQQAGLRISWSFDMDAKAGMTYKLNFSHTEFHELPVHKFVEVASQKDFMVDVLHISPPCQPYSPANTTPNEFLNEINQAATLSICALLDVIRPRIVTIEETAGLVSRHSQWFDAVVNIFIQKGFSIRWKLATCGDYGVPQPTRKRLLIVAAGPGEILPTFPAPTHAIIPTVFRRKVPNIGESIANLDGVSDHDINTAMRYNRQPFSPEMYGKTVTCNSGVGNYHPSGTRNYTIRELACLQTFPRSFRFADVGLTSKRRQVGNAVPPILAKAMFKQIIKCLELADAAELALEQDIHMID